MFSAVPFNLNLKTDTSSLVTIGDVTGSSKLLVPGKATAATDIPQGAVTTPIDPKLLAGHCHVSQITISTNAGGIMNLNNPSKQAWSKNVHWVRALRLSDDCHSCNIQLRLQPPSDKSCSPPKLILEAMRPIAAGQELLLWFSEDILAMLQMAFLIPANIQGQKKYMCTRCSTLYESPNPLKLHITLGCGRQTISDLWDKLKRLLLENSKAQSTTKHNAFTFQLTSETSLFKEKAAIDLSITNNSINVKRPTSQPPITSNYFYNSAITEDSKMLYRPYSEPPTRTSAFKPFQKSDCDNQEQNLAKNANAMCNLPNRQLCWSNLPLNSNLYNYNFITQAAPAADESQIETLVSSLGKSKNGHVCLYCGKCYSRKYGLKIHIRTHTGYKPLKCKFCSRPFGDPSNLNKHVRLHAEGETPYKCDLCGKVLVRRRDLERHLKSRHLSEINPGRNIVVEESVSEPEETDEDVEDLTVDR